MATSTNSRNLLLSTAASRTVTNQKTVVLSAPVTVFLYTSAGALLDSTATIAITATRQNTTEPIVWTNNGGITLYTAATGGTAVLTPDTTPGTTVTVYVRASDFSTLNLNSLLVTATITDVDIFSSSLAITKLQPGSAGVAGDTAVFAYRVISGASLPAAPSITQGTVPTAGAAVTGTTWYLQPKATLAAEEWMFQVSGTRTAAGVYTWQTQGYLSTFKVGKLEALTTDTGNLTVSVTGSIKTAASVYGQAGAFFIGNDGGTTKFSIGDKLLYSGTTFSLPGITIGSTGAISGIGTGNGTIINNDSIRPGGVNLVGNSGFLRNNASLPTNWGIYNNSGITVTNSVQTGGMFGQNYVRVTAGASTPTTLGIYVAQSTSDSVKSWEPAQTYCVSFWARASAGGLGKKMYGLYSNMGFTGGVDLENPVLTSSWQRYVFRGIPVSNSFTVNGELYISVEVQGTTTPLPSGSVIDICCPKVELGTQPSSWTPSPQDTMNINLEPSITAKLSKSSADILTGPITVSTTGGIVAGTLTWDNTGTRTGGQGVAVTPKGIVGHDGIKTTFAIDATTGDATFSGSLSAATGSFAGSLSAATGSFAGSLSAATGTFSGSLSAATGSFAGSLSAATGTLGTLTINSGGNIKSGQTAYNTGTGFYLGTDSGTPKFSIGNSAGANLQWTGTELLINTPTFESFTTSIASGNIVTSVSHGNQLYGSRTISATGGKPPYSYAWFLTGASYAYVVNATSPTVTVYGFGDGNTATGIVVGLVRDSNGRITFSSFSFSATHSASTSGA